jgi:hypothetical protein
MKKAIAALLTVAVLGGGAVAWLLYARAEALAAIPPQAVATERALALPGLMALATVNVAGLVQLDEDLHGAPPQADPEATAPPQAGADPAGQGEDDWPARLARAGVDLRRDVSHLTAAVYARSDGEPGASGAHGEAGGVGLALGLFGDFAPDAIERALREDPQFEVTEYQIGARSVLQVTVTERDTCQASGPWALHLAHERVLVSDPHSLRSILGRLSHSESAGRDLARFQEFRDGTFASAALFVPDELPAGIGNPFVAMSAHSAKDQLEGFRALYLGAGASVFPPGLLLASLLEADDPGTAEAVAERWREALARVRTTLEEKLPTAAALHEALEIATEGNELSLEARLGAGEAEQLKQLPGEMMELIFGGLSRGLGAMMTMGAGLAEEQIDENPVRFADQQRAEDLARFDPDKPFSGPVDQISGPFGFRLALLALSDDPVAGPELIVEAVGTDVPNLGDRVERAQLVVTRVAGLGGEELMVQQVCGPERNDLPVAFQSMGQGTLTAGKRVRLRPGADASEIEHVAGHVRLRLPVRTETVHLSGPLAGQTVERAGARLELNQPSPSTVAWKVSGDARRLLHLRALNAQGRPLQSLGGSSMDALFGGGKSGSTSYAGEVAQLEAVFALREEIWEYPFDLRNPRPGTGGEHLAPRELEFEPVPLATLNREFGRAAKRLAEGKEQTVAAGPFAVTLEQVWSFGGLMPRFEVHAPKVPSLEQSLSGLEFVLDEIHLRNGIVHRPPAPSAGTDAPDAAGPFAGASANAAGLFSRAPDTATWQQLVDLSESWGSEGLSGGVQLETGAPGAAEDVARLVGTLVVRMPRRVATYAFAEYELGAWFSSRGIELRIAEIGRDRFALRAARGGERVVAVRAYNAAGGELWIHSSTAERGPAGWRGEFGVSGIPARVEVMVAEKLDTAEYPYALALAPAADSQRAALPAAPPAAPAP